jgi:glycerol-3-phosphate dehydrogenase (NAD(P)+)
VVLPRTIHVTASLAEAVQADALLLAVPAQYTRSVLEQCRMPAGTWLISCAKGIEAASGLLMSELLEELFPQHPHAVLTGPAFAAELARGLPTAMLLASHTGCPLRPWLSHETLAIQENQDVIGCQIGGAVKNIIAIACGLADGLGYGQNTAAALETRGLQEMAQLSQRKGGRPETILSLAGAGDLALTCGSNQSRNYRLGQALATGAPLTKLLEGQKAVPEGAVNAAALHLLCQHLSLSLPLCEAIYQVLYEGSDAKESILRCFLL